MNVLVVGKAKTGTTFLSKTIANSLQNVKYHMEPKDVAYFKSNTFNESESHVVKIIYEHWNQDPNGRMDLINSELGLNFDKVVFIVRDPRDEVISRMMYFIYPYFQKNGFNQDAYDQWVKVCETKEKNPSSYTFIQMIHELNSIFGVKFENQFMKMNAYFSFVRKHAKPVGHIAKYERIVDGLFVKLESYLGITLVPPESDNGKALQRVSRSAKYNNWKQFFTGTDTRLLKPHFRKSKLYSLQNWTIPDQQVIEPSECSLYVKRICEEFNKGMFSSRTSIFKRKS